MNVWRGSAGSVSRKGSAGPPERWGTSGEAFLSKFNPDRQAVCARFPERCIAGGAPSLIKVREWYGQAVLECWLDIQLTDLVMFAGVRKSEAADLTGRLAQVIADNYGSLKVSELMLFFQHFKSGRYGRFYGQFDPMVVTCALNAFMEYRSEVAGRISREAERLRRESAARERRRLEEAGELLTHAEWMELRWLFNMGYERERKAQCPAGAA